MKSMIKSICAVIMILSIVLGCSHYVSKSFFSESLKRSLIEEVNIKGHIATLFDQFKNSIPFMDTTAIDKIQEDIMNNDKLEDRVLIAGENMLEDIVNPEQQNQDMNTIVEELLMGYEKEFQEILSPFLSGDQIKQTIVELSNSMPIQQFYDVSVETFQQQIPSSYIFLYKLVETISKVESLYLAIVGLLLSIITLFILGREHAAWALPIGVATLIISAGLLIGGILIPIVYRGMIQGVNNIFIEVLKMDFALLTYTGFVCLGIGIVCMVIHFKVTRKYMD